MIYRMSTVSHSVHDSQQTHVERETERDNIIINNNSRQYSMLQLIDVKDTATERSRYRHPEPASEDMSTGTCRPS